VRKEMKYVLKWIAWVLVIIGGLNWGLVGLFNFDLVASIFGEGSLASSIVYSLVGLSALVLIVFKVVKMSGKGRR
jgi:uncharacterized membrane protein YuzA (DUF378 family)